MVLRAEALEHLLSIVRKAEPPSRQTLHEEFIFRDDFKKWLIWSKFSLPAFWYGNEETDTGDAKAGEACRNDDS